AITLSEKSTLTHQAVSHGNWGIALLRMGEQRAAAGEALDDLATRSRHHLGIALELAEQEFDEMRIADRMASLGMVAMLDGKLDEAEHLLTESLRRSVSLDYVRTAASSALYLGKLHLHRGDAAKSVEALRQAVAHATRGAAADILPTAQLLLADALDLGGDAYEAVLLRTTSEKLRSDNAVTRGRAAEDARQLAAKILESGD
ncbi:MAG: hypothetical protein ABI905_11390, partial [Betaproteobacteria bacterium]